MHAARARGGITRSTTPKGCHGGLNSIKGCRLKIMNGSWAKSKSTMKHPRRLEGIWHYKPAPPGYHDECTSPDSGSFFFFCRS